MFAIQDIGVLGPAMEGLSGTDAPCYLSLVVERYPADLLLASLRHKPGSGTVRSTRSLLWPADLLLTKSWHKTAFGTAKSNIEYRPPSWSAPKFIMQKDCHCCLLEHQGELFWLCNSSCPRGAIYQEVKQRIMYLPLSSFKSDILDLNS